MAGYRVVTDALRTEANWWNLRADHMSDIVKAVQGTKLGTTAFFTGDPITLEMSAASGIPESHAYETFRSWVEGTLQEAVGQFQELAVVLGRIAHDYDQAEKVVEIDLTKAYEN